MGTKREPHKCARNSRWIPSEIPECAEMNKEKQSGISTIREFHKTACTKDIIQVGRREIRVRVSWKIRTTMAEMEAKGLTGRWIKVCKDANPTEGVMLRSVICFTPYVRFSHAYLSGPWDTLRMRDGWLIWQWESQLHSSINTSSTSLLSFSLVLW